MNLVTGLTGGVCGALVWTLGRTIDLAHSRPRRIVHEAGHALLMARSPYIRCTRATIVPKLFGAEGHCIGYERAKTTVGSVLDSAVVFMGGLGGEAVARDFYEVSGGRSDIAGAQAELRKIVGPSPPTLRQAFIIAQVLIRRDRPTFDRLCNALDTHDTLEEAQIRAIVGPPR